MAEPAAFPALPTTPPGAVFPAADVRPGAVPLTIWPAVPLPGRCPACPDPVPCPRRFSTQAVATVISAFSRPSDLVVIPRADCGALVVAPAAAHRHVLALAATAGDLQELAGRLDRELDPTLRHLVRLRTGSPEELLRGSSGEAGQATLAVTAECPGHCCPLPVPVDDNSGARSAEWGSAVLYAACQRMLAPGGRLLVITSAVRQPGFAGQVIVHARAAGLVYAQHIIALHAPIRGGCLASPWQQPSLPYEDEPAAVPLNLPVHTDLLLFTQPGGPRHD